MLANRRARSKAAADHSAQYRVEAIVRAARLLREFTRASPHRSIDQLARSLRLSTGLTRRTLQTLQHHGLVRHVEDAPEIYELGLTWLRLADVRRRQVDMRQLALPVMRRMRDAVNETIILSIRAGHRRVNIDYVESTQTIRRLTQLGFEAPLHIGAAGRALMAGLRSEQLEDYFGAVALRRFGNGKPVEKSTLLKQLERIRQQGYAVAFREITSDTAAVAAPIHDHAHSIVAALTISCPEDRFTPALKRACIREVTKGAADVSRALGFNPEME